MNSLLIGVGTVKGLCDLKPTFQVLTLPRVPFPAGFDVILEKLGQESMTWGWNAGDPAQV